MFKFKLKNISWGPLIIRLSSPQEACGNKLVIKSQNINIYTTLRKNIVKAIHVIGRSKEGRHII